MSDAGERLRAARLERGLSRARLARSSGITRERIGAIERGERRLSATDAAYLAQALGLRSHDLRDAAVAPAQVTAVRHHSPEVEAVRAWFADFVEDAIYLERQVRRYGLE